MDFEIKISLVEMLWRGIRRIKSQKDPSKLSLLANIPLKGIEKLNATNFECDAIEWLKSSKCLTSDLGYYPVHGKFILAVSTKDKTVSDYEFKEVIVTSCILRAHINFVGSDEMVKTEIPYSHLVGMSVESDRIDLSCKLSSEYFNVIWLCKNDEYQKDTWTPTEDRYSLNPKQENGVPQTAGLSGRVKIAHTKNMEWDMDFDLESPKKHVENGLLIIVFFTLVSSTASIMESLVDSAYSSDLSNECLSYNKPFDEPLLGHAKMTLQSFDSVEDEPLMTSLRIYRQGKSKEMLAMFRKLYREEWESAKLAINKLCNTQQTRRAKLQQEYKRQVNALVAAIEKSHQELVTQMKELLGIIDAIKHNCAQHKELSKTEPKAKYVESNNVLIANSKDLLIATDNAIKDMDVTIQMIRQHYIKKKNDCSRALKQICVG
ncbi:hypothetical protein BdWA1_001440 [Babesia duncani]|uniref:Uncharacterized protein n=1 Tax=Babesia duncani TaxID=323732 RepID=A0AAD9PPF1_9APIC|nr:hypothetical protein BdWA1_001440 [Babesia duncani]